MVSSFVIRPNQANIWINELAPVREAKREPVEQRGPLWNHKVEPNLAGRKVHPPFQE